MKLLLYDVSCQIEFIRYFYEINKCAAFIFWYIKANIHKMQYIFNINFTKILLKNCILNNYLIKSKKNLF